MTHHWWTGVVWMIVMFLSAVWLSFWRHPFTASEGMLHFPKSVLMKKHLWCWVHFQQILILGELFLQMHFVYRAVNELHVFVPSVWIGCALWLLYGGVWVRLWIWSPHEPRSAPELESLPRSDCPEPPESEESLRNRWKQTRHSSSRRTALFKRTLPVTFKETARNALS